MELTLFIAAIYAGTGLIAGFLAGLLGIGGGMILVPALLAVFVWQGVDSALSTHMAIGTSLASILLTSMSSVRSHHRNGNVLWPTVWRLTPGLLIGSLAGAYVAHALAANVLQLLIGAFAFWTGIKLIRAKPATPGQRQQLPKPIVQVAAGGVIGSASAIFGIGGGSLTVPFLCHYGTKMQQAVGTAAACGFPIALAGSIGFIWSGWDLPGLPHGSLGYIFLPALIALSATSIFAARWGANAAHRLPAQTLKKYFGVLLLLVGTQFLLGVSA